MHRLDATPLATWVMVLTAAGQTLTVPTYLARRSRAAGSLGPAFIAICLPPPDVPVGTPGRATFGAKVYSAELTINGVFSSVAAGAWVSSWVPYTPRRRHGERRRSRRRTGRDRTRCSDPRREDLREGSDRHGSRDAGRSATRGATVTIFGGLRGRPASGRVGRASGGRERQRSRSGPQIGTFFRATAVAAPGAAPAVCAQLRPLIAPIPCVNPTANGFNVQSKVVRKKK